MWCGCARVSVTSPPCSPGAAATQQIRREACARARDLIASLPIPPGCAVAATGSLARGELTERSDLDLVLIRPEGATVEEGGVEKLWQGVWQAGYRLDYAVRTPADNVAMVGTDVTAALALLDLTAVAGDADLVARTRREVVAAWRAMLPRRLPDVIDVAIARWRRSGSVVAMTHPDLKHGRGGLRDIELIRAVALGNLCDAPRLETQRELLLNARTLVHRHARRPRDVLDPEFAADVAEDLGFVDRYELSALLSEAARDVDAAVRAGLSTARAMIGTRRSPGHRAVRRPLALDVVESSGQVVLARNANVEDPGLVLRVGAAAARAGLPVAERTLATLTQCPRLPERIPRFAAADFFALLASPTNCAPVVRQLDAYGLWEPIVPEWGKIRGLMPRERTHIRTIDDHLLATVANCAAATVMVPRPDLLLLAALYHDLGKFRRPRHEITGAQLVARMAARLGLNLRDRGCVQTLVAEHSTIARLAASRDVTAEETLDELLDAVHYGVLTLELLGVLLEADSLATGPGVFSPRLARARDVLIRRGRARLTSVTPRPPLVHAPTALGVAPDAAGIRVWWRGRRRADVLAVLAVISAKACTIDSARIATHADGQAHAELIVRPTVEHEVEPETFIQAYKSGVHSALPPVRPEATATYWNGAVVEVRTVDRIAAFGALLAALPDTEWMRMDSPGGTMIVQAQLHPGVDRAAVERRIDAALGDRSRLSAGLQLP